MFKVGIDFDNTIVQYDELFYNLALEKNLINSNVPKNKIDIRNYLRSIGKDNEFTLLQGEVYGARIKDAEPAFKCIETIKKFIKNNIEVFIISHKTKYPYAGEKYNLHNAARDWLNYYSFFQSSGAGLNKNKVFFNLTKEEKIKKIHEVGCDFFIDDLPEILDLLDENISKILYNPKLFRHKVLYDLDAANWQIIGDFICNNCG